MFGGNIWLVLGSFFALIIVAFTPDRWAEKFADATAGVIMTAWKAVSSMWSWVASLDHKCQEAFARVTLTRMAVIGTMVALCATMLMYCNVVPANSPSPSSEEAPAKQASNFEAAHSADR